MRVRRLSVCVVVAMLLAGCSEPTPPEPTNLILESVKTITTGVVGELTEDPPAVRAKRESDGRPVAGVIVQFRPFTPISGSISATVDTTDALGVATAGRWTLGTGPGSQTILATAVQYGRSTAIYAAAKAGPPVAFAPVGFTRQYVLTARQPNLPMVRVTDKYNNAVSGISVTFAAAADGGSLAAASATTGSIGTASPGAWTIPAAIATYSVTASMAAQPVLAFTAQRVDSSSLVWYALDSVTSLSRIYTPAEWGYKAARLGLSSFDPCLCVPFDGYFFEIFDFSSGSHAEGSGSLVLAGGKLSMNGGEPLEFSGNTVKVKRLDYYYVLDTWTYSRRN